MVWVRLSIVLLLIILAGILRLNGSDIPHDPRLAHQWADAILSLEFEASYNRYRSQHPGDRRAGSWDHVDASNVSDRERWQDVLRRFEDYKRAMKRAGYE